MGAATPGETLGTLYDIRNETKQHTPIPSVGTNKQSKTRACAERLSASNWFVRTLNRLL